MQETVLSRRNAVAGLSAAGVALGVSSPGLSARASALPDSVSDWTQEDRVYALAKQQGRIDDGKVIWRTRGVIYGFKAPDSPVPLVRFKGCEQQWVKRISDAEFIKYNSLLTYYSDIDSDEIIDGFTIR